MNVSRPLFVALVAISVVASVLFVPPIDADAQRARPNITNLGLVDGSTLSWAGAPNAFPRNRNTVFIRGRVDANATRVLVRVQDFWSDREWHPNRACRRGGVSCVEGTMGVGRRVSNASLGKPQAGTKAFTFKANLPNGLYRFTIFARQGLGKAGKVETRWFKVNRGATAFASRSQVLVSRPGVNQPVASRNAAGEIPFRIAATASSLELEWRLRQDRTGRFFNAETGRYQDRSVQNLRLFDRWQSVDFGRTIFDWDVPAAPGQYTLWLTAVDGQGRKGLTTRQVISIR